MTGNEHTFMKQHTNIMLWVVSMMVECDYSFPDSLFWLPAAVTTITAKAFVVLHNNNGLDPEVAPQEVPRRHLTWKSALYFYTQTILALYSPSM